jgi:peptidoglycan/LPS O-acetylase OafA/YrhL
MASATRAVDRAQSERLYYVDAIRTLAIGLVLLAHVVEVFNPWDEWHITNLERSRVAGEIAVLVAPWVMPIVMLLAGVSAWYSLRRRDNTTYVRERAVRLLVPLVAGTLILVPPQVYLERRLHGQFSGSFFAFYPHFFQGVYPDGNLSWHHLWFLAHLFAYSVLALPLFRYLQREDNRAMHWAARVCGGPGGILWLAVPLILERNLLWGLFRERHMLTSDWSNHALLFVAYIYGFILAGSPWLGTVIDAQWRRSLMLGVVGTGVLGLGAWSGIVPSRIPPPYSLRYLAFWTLYAVCAWAWMVGVLGAGRRWVRHDSPLLRYGRRVGYGLYIVHQPIIVAIAFVVVQWHQPVVVKFVVLLLTSVIGTVLSVEVLSRVPVARALLGLSSSRAASASDSDRPEERRAEGPPPSPRLAQ